MRVLCAQRAGSLVGETVGDLPPSNHETGFLALRLDTGRFLSQRERKLGAVNDKRDGGRL